MVNVRGKVWRRTSTQPVGPESGGPDSKWLELLQFLSGIFNCMADVTQLLDAVAAGDPKAAADLLPLVYDELRAMAHIVDLHQLTKDPDAIFSAGRDTSSSPKRTLSAAELGR